MQVEDHICPAGSNNQSFSRSENSAAVRFKLSEGNSQMGSVGFEGEDEYLSSNDKKYKLPRTLLDECGAVNHVSVPRKLRSAIKKQRRASVTPPLSILRKHYHMLDGKNGSKKSKLNKKPRQVTKDEEEVADTLNALADMFCNANKATKPRSNNEPPEIKSSAALEAEDTGNHTLKEESRKITSNSTPSASGNQSKTRSHRSIVVFIDTGPSAKQTIASDQITVPGAEHWKLNYPMDDRNNGLSLSASMSAREALSSEESCLQYKNLSHPAGFENTFSVPQHCAIEESTPTLKHPRAHKSRKRCAAHVYISRLINVLKISERRDGLPENPTGSTSCEGTALHIHPGMHNQKVGIAGRNGCTSFSGITHSSDIPNDNISQIRFHQQQASETSALYNSKNQCYDFLSLGNGVISRKGHCPGSPKQFHALYMQQQNGHSSTFPGHTTASAAQQLLPQYLSSLPVGTGQQVEAQLQKGTVNLQTQANTRVASSLHLPDWRNGGGNSPSLQNYAVSVFPHLLGSQHLQFSAPQQQFTSINSLSSTLPPSTVKIRYQQQLPWQFERNRAVFYHENIQQLQQPCYDHFPNC